MSLDPYAPCPCGSGKKFKWCCQPVHVDIDRAFRQEEEGQHEAALRIMADVVGKHPDNPEAWGRQAELLYQNGQYDQAEESLQHALEVSPSYPFGHLLRGMFRQNEGEFAGAVILFRQAADLYDPEARDLLAVAYSRIGECELKLNRPVAARAALQLALRCQPGNEALRQVFDQIFGDKARLPAPARSEYSFQSLSPGSPQRAGWDQALAELEHGRFTAAVKAVESLVAMDPEAVAAWYNLGLARAWVGDNRGALEALDRYVALEADDTGAAKAWELAEVLRLGHGMEDDADYLEHAAVFQIRNPEPVFGFLQRWDTEQRLVGVQINQEQGLVTGIVLDRVTALTVAHATTQSPGLGAYLLLMGDVLRLWHSHADALGRARDEIRQQLGPALSEPRLERTVASFTDVLAEALVFPVGVSDEAEGQRRIRAGMERYFEDRWIHRRLHSLGDATPEDAASQPTLRRKLLGVVQFLEDCAATTSPMYDFDRLRRQLGLTATALPATPGQPQATIEPSALASAELAELDPEALTDDALEQAYQAALKLDARELATRFAKALIARPPRADRPDRYSWYAHLIRAALTTGNTDAALDYVNEGEKADAEYNAGRRRNDYELRRGQLHMHRGEVDLAEGVFQRLIDQAPNELQYRSSATEAMLSARRVDQALRFAEAGLALARQKSDRDSEQHFQELAAAARKHGASVPSPLVGKG